LGNNQLTIPNPVTTIDKGAFFSNQLTEVTILNPATEIDDKAFDDCY